MSSIFVTNCWLQVFSATFCTHLNSFTSIFISYARKKNSFVPCKSRESFFFSLFFRHSLTHSLASLLVVLFCDAFYKELFFFSSLIHSIWRHTESSLIRDKNLLHCHSLLLINLGIKHRLKTNHNMVMEAKPSPLVVGREFVRQYYTLLHNSPDHLHRYFPQNSTLKKSSKIPFHFL